MTVDEIVQEFAWWEIENKSNCTFPIYPVKYILHDDGELEMHFDLCKTRTVDTSSKSIYCTVRVKGSIAEWEENIGEGNFKQFETTIKYARNKGVIGWSDKRTPDYIRIDGKLVYKPKSTLLQLYKYYETPAIVLAKFGKPKYDYYAPRQKKIRTHCKYNHELTPDNTFNSTNGSLSCKACRERHKEKYYLKHFPNRKHRNKNEE